MFRIPVKISTTEVIKLNARLTSNVRQLATPPPNFSAPPPPPPPHEEEPRRAGFGGKLFLAALGVSAITGATLAYAKNNQDFRNILKEYVPWTDDAIALLYLEKEVPGSWVVAQVKDLASSASDMVFGETKPAQTNVDLLAPIKPPPLLQEVSYPKEEDTAKTEEISSDQVKDEVGEVKLVSSQKPEPPCPTHAPIAESEQFLAVLNAAAAEANAAYKHAIVTLQEYTAKVNTVMESCAEGGTGAGPWDELKRANKKKLEAECRVRAAIKKLDTCSGIKAERARADLSSLRQEYEKSKAAADVAARYWPQVEEARRHFVDEIEALFPRADIANSQLDTRGGDTDTLLLVALRRVLLYQQLIAKVDCELTQRVDDALKGSDEDVLKAKVEIELERERRELAVIFQKKMAIARAEADRELAAQLKRQMEIFQIQLQDALDHRAEIVRREERKLADEAAAAEKAAQGVRLSAVLGRLQGVDAALKARSDADKMARQAQLLWAASEALEGVLRGRGSKQTRVSVARELEAIATAAADTDELVAAVLRGVPAAAREKGVLSEICLRERFLKVEKIARSLSLVPACGARLHIFALSWLQGLMLVRSPPPARSEIKDEPTDFSKLDNYDILERARYCVERGQWGQALRYVQLLKGAAGTVARDWANEMALHLEARQAASALLAHASASGLLHL